MNMIRGYQIPMQGHVDVRKLLEAPARISLEGDALSIEGVMGFIRDTQISSTEYRWVKANHYDITPNWRPGL